MRAKTTITGAPMRGGHILGLMAVLAAGLAGCDAGKKASDRSAFDDASGSGAVGGAFGNNAGAGDGGGDGDAYYGAGTGGAGGAYDLPVDREQQPATQRQINPFVVVAHDPFSTFAADVDTASYDGFLRDVRGGSLPAPERVRLEEFVNYFHYDYPMPAQDAEHPFTISLQAAPNPLGRDTLLLRVGIQAVELVASDHGAGPANVVFLVDVSGSMQSADKLPLVKRVMHRTLGLLSDDDRVSIVTYASGTGVALPSTPVSEGSTIDAAIGALSAGGGTNGAGGIQLAYEQAEAGRVDGINHVVLMTDGDFNVGAASDEALVALIEDKRRTGVTFTALGFGGNPNDSMMEKITNAGNGIYGLITGQAQCDAYVDERMLSTLVHAARDMKLQVEWNPEHVYAYRLLGYENRDIADEDFRDDSVDAGDVGSGHQVTALYEVVPAGGEIPRPEGAETPEDGDPVEGAREVGADEMVRVKVRYEDPQAPQDAAAMETAAALPKLTDAVDFAGADPDTRWAIGVAGLAELVGLSPYANPSRFADVAAILQSEAGDDPDRKALAELLSTIEGLL